MIDGYDPHRGCPLPLCMSVIFTLPSGQKVAGHRGYFLKGIGARLNLAIISYGTDFLSKRGYTALQTPFFMNKEAMAKTAQLSQFDEELYKVLRYFFFLSINLSNSMSRSRRDPVTKRRISTLSLPRSSLFRPITAMSG